MQDYSELYPKPFRSKNFTHKQQIKIIRRILGSDASPIVIVLSIMAFLSTTKH
jgi:hypothetical protein